MLSVQDRKARGARRSGHWLANGDRTCYKQATMKLKLTAGPWARETAEELAAELAPGGDSPGDLNDVLERAYVGRHGASVGLWEPGRSSSGCSSPTSPGSSRGGRG